MTFVTNALLASEKLIHSRRSPIPPPHALSLAVAIRGAQYMSLWREHHVVERLSKHRCREKSHCAERIRPDIDQIMPKRCGQHKDASRSNGMLAAIFQLKFPAPGNDVLRFFRRVRMPTKPPSRFDFINDCRGFGRSVPAIQNKSPVPPHTLFTVSTDKDAFEFV